MAGVWPTSVAAPGGQWTTTCDVSISSESPLGKAAQATPGGRTSSSRTVAFEDETRKVFPLRHPRNRG